MGSAGHDDLEITCGRGAVSPWWCIGHNGTKPLNSQHRSLTSPAALAATGLVAWVAYFDLAAGSRANNLVTEAIGIA